MRITAIKIICSTFLDDLERQANCLIREGWEPQGGVAYSVSPLGWSIAMIRRETQTDKWQREKQAMKIPSLDEGLLMKKKRHE